MIPVGKPHSVAIVGDTPETLLLSVLYAEAGIPNYLVGPFGDNGRTHVNRPGIEEILWLLGILTRSGQIALLSDYRELPLSHIRTLILADHITGPENGNALETVVKNLAPFISKGSTVAFTGLCTPHYTRSVLRSTVERYGGVTVGSEVNLYYVPLFWKGERIQEFRDTPKILAPAQNGPSREFEEQLLRVFPTLTIASKPEVAEASGLFSAISHEVGKALGLELAKISESNGVDLEEAISLCKDIGTINIRRAGRISGRESIATTIALSHSSRQPVSRLVRAAYSVNEDYQSQLVGMISGALRQCGHPFRRSRVAILGTEGLLKNSWAKLESLPLIGLLRKRGARISLYPGDDGFLPWARILGNEAEVQNSLLRAVSKANCTVVALPDSIVSALDVDQMAVEMNRPGAVCDLTGVLEASNVERAGLFYTTIGRGNPIS